MGGKDGRAGLGHTWGCRGMLPPHAQHGGGSRLRRHVRAGCMHSSAAVCTCDTTSTSTVSIVPLPSTAAEGTRHTSVAQRRSRAWKRQTHHATSRPAPLHTSRSSSNAEVAGAAGHAPGEGVERPDSCRKRRPPPQLVRRLAAAAEAGPTACSSTASSRAAAQAARRSCPRCIRDVSGPLAPPDCRRNAPRPRKRGRRGGGCRRLA